MKLKFKFGDTGTWHKSASERTKAEDIPAVVLEDKANGTMYIFMAFPPKGSFNNLTGRTATIPYTDFTKD